VFNTGNEYLEEFYEKKKERLKDPRCRIIEMTRIKMMLLSYLLRIPESLGIKVWSPYLCEDVAMAMLNLPKKSRENRAWQSDFFRRKGVMLEDMGLQSDKRNVLDKEAIKNISPSLLDVEKLSELFNRDYIKWINETINVPNIKRKLKQYMITTRYVKHAYAMLGGKDDLAAAYNAYLTIRPIEQLLIKK
jgi:hypothetical protein